MDQHGPPWLHADFIQQPLHAVDADLGAVVPLGQVALAFGTGDDAKPSPATLQRVHQILRVDLAAAWDFMNYDMGAVVLPLTRQRSCPSTQLAQTHTSTSGHTGCDMKPPNAKESFPRIEEQVSREE